MADLDEIGWADLEAEGLRALGWEEFEAFCFDLISFESYDRHDGPQLDGPAGRAVADGGRDILLTIKRAPSISKKDYQKKFHLSPLTEDPETGTTSIRTAYSCKAGKSWLDDALDDARTQADRAVEVLSQGGYFKLLINTPGKLDGKVSRGKKGETPIEATPHEHLVTAFWKRLKESNANAEKPGAKIEIVDANTIAAFLRSRQPEGGLDRWTHRFGVRPVLKSLAEWRAIHVEDRQEPAFADDPARGQIMDELAGLFGAIPTDVEDRVACLVGQPGVGKTRLVLEALLREPALAKRVRVALSPEEAGDALDTGRLLRRHPRVLLVVDDCLRTEAEAIAARFRAAAKTGSSAHLLTLVPASREAADQSRARHTWFLDPLDAESARSVVAKEMGRATDDADVVEMARLSGGFPWFARLLAVEARDQGRAPRDMKEAVRWALASHREANTEPDREALRFRRARGLLAASLTRRIDWLQLSPQQKDEVSKAVGFTHWDELFEAARQCHARGILRRRDNWHFKYITPSILEREIIAWLLGPDGPDPGGRTLARHGQDYLSDFFETIGQLGLSSAVITAIARIGLEDLVRAHTDWTAWRQVGLLGPRLMFIARHLPGATAHHLRQQIEAARMEELANLAAEPPALVFALEELSSRKDAFDDAEASLFRLAQSGQHRRADHALVKWASLFLVELNATHRGIEERMDLLARRLNEPAPLARLVALGGVEPILGGRVFRRALAPLDGEWATPTADEARLARCRAWQLVAARISDSDGAVSNRAKTLAVDNIRSAVRAGLGEQAMVAIEAHLSDFSEADRVRLREKLEEVRTYDAGWLDPANEYPTRLEEAVAPNSFRERLFQRVGAWGPAALRKNDDALDDALAREGLAGDPPPLLAELDWLISDEAQRSHVFAYALGRNDVQGVLLTGLRERAKSWRTLWKARLVFARYLGGWSEAGRHLDAEAILRDMHANPDEAPVLALAIIEVGPTPERISWIESALRAGRLDPAAVMELGRRRSWLSGVNDDDFASLVGVLVEGAAIEHPASALEMMVDRIKDRPSTMASVRPLLLRALERLAPVLVHGMTDHYWELGATTLIDQGELSRVAELALIALARPRGSNDHAWNTLHQVADRDIRAVWNATSAALDRQDADAEHILMAFRFHRVSFAWPREDVLAWSGHDERRGRTVVSLVRPYEPKLEPTLRALVQRFGANSSVAGEIMARIHSTEGMTTSLAAHDAEQLKHARGWLTDADPEIVAFARRLVESLERSYERHAAYEDDERRRYGT